MKNSQSGERQIGPDAKDILRARPYFAVQLESPQAGDGGQGKARVVATDEQLREANKRIIQHLKSAESAVPLSDIYLLSHGWHRNYFQATSVYDRLIGRFLNLERRGVIDPPDNYRPLYVCLHWHSDPGGDGWVDPLGRRNKQSFLDNVKRAFQSPGLGLSEASPQIDSSAFIRDFEEIFEYLSQVSTVETAPLSDDEWLAKGEAAARLLDRHRLMQNGDAGLAEKAVAVWCCYYEATPRGQLTDQSTRPARGITIKQTTFRLVSVIAVLAIIGVILQHLQTLISPFRHFAASLHAALCKSLPNPSGAEWTALLWWKKALAFAYSQTAWTVSDLIVIALTLITLAVLSALLLIALGNRDEKDKVRLGSPFFVLAAWGVLEIACIIPALLFIIATYFFSPSRNSLDERGIWSERLGKRNPNPSDPSDLPNSNPDDLNEIISGSLRTKSLSYRRRLLRFAMIPVDLYKSALHENNPARSRLDLVERQLSFYEMQARGTVAGASAARFLSRLLMDLNDQNLIGSETRIHLLGHSFGCLVAMNALRHLVFDPDCQPPKFRTDNTPVISSVCLLEAAIASNWIEAESVLAQSVRGVIASFFSAYDTATGFYYPLGDGGRYAAGSVGLTGLNGPGAKSPTPPLHIPRYDKDGQEIREEDKGMFALIVKPPDLNKLIDPIKDLAEGRVINLDVSRLCYQGSPLTGGGHDDIFKDDIVNLCWAVMALSRQLPY
jgi:hypothetical protein